MKKTTFTGCIPAVACGLAIAMTAGLSTAANAQGPSALGGPTAISVGAYWPNSDEASHAGGSTQIDADLRYHIPVKDNPITIPSRTILEAGVEAGASHGNHNTIIPVTIGEEFGMNQKSPLATNNGYVGAGVGVYFMNQSGLSSAARLGGYVSAGYNFTPSVFGEAKYQWVDHGNGPLVNVGYRF
jgi:hypothetical protein